MRPYQVYAVATLLLTLLLPEVSLAQTRTPVPATQPSYNYPGSNPSNSGAERNCITEKERVSDARLNEREAGINATTHPRGQSFGEMVANQQAYVDAVAGTSDQAQYAEEVCGY